MMITINVLYQIASRPKTGPVSFHAPCTARKFVPSAADLKISRLRHHLCERHPQGPPDHEDHEDQVRLGIIEEMV